MNKKILAILIVLAVLNVGTALAARQRGDSVGFRDTIVVSRDETRESVVTFGGDINVEGKVRKSVLAFGGTITISGEVDDSVVGFGSRITLKSTAVIKHDLVSLGGTIDKEPGFRVDGDTVYFKGSEISGKVLSEGLKGLLTFTFWPIILIFKMVNIFVWALLGFVVAMLFPKQVTLAGGEIRRSFWPIFGTGLLALICFTFLVIFAAVLCLLLIGIPILFALIIGGFVVKIFGKVALFYFFGESLLRKAKASPLGAVMLGLLLVSLIGFIPIIGWLFSMVLSIVGWGVAIRTKFGTTENWFQRKRVPPAPAPTA
jgi:hypothetical protein